MKTELFGFPELRVLQWKLFGQISLLRSRDKRWSNVLNTVFIIVVIKVKCLLYETGFQFLFQTIAWLTGITKKKVLPTKLAYLI